MGRFIDKYWQDNGPSVALLDNFVTLAVHFSITQHGWLLEGPSFLENPFLWRDDGLYQEIRRAIWELLAELDETGHPEVLQGAELPPRYVSETWGGHTFRTHFRNDPEFYGKVVRVVAQRVFENNPQWFSPAFGDSFQPMWPGALAPTPVRPRKRGTW